MKNPTTGRRWKVKTTGYYGTPHLSQARNARERSEYKMEGGPITAVGDRVGKGDIAVPPHVPLGTVFYIPNYGWGVARDHGSAIQGNHIDLAHGGVVNGQVNPQARTAAQSWGERYQTVYVFPKGFQIPADRKPPQAYINDVNRKQSTVAALPDRESKPVIPQRPKVKADSHFTPIPPANTHNAPLHLRSASPDEINWANYVAGWDKKHPEDKSFTMSTRGAKAYGREMEHAWANAYGTADQWDEGRKAIDDVFDRVLYQAHKKRITPDHYNYLNEQYKHLKKLLTPDNAQGIQPNMHNEDVYRRGQNDPIARAEWPDPIPQSMLQPKMHEVKHPTADDVQASVPHHEVQPIHPLDRMVMQHFADRQSNFNRQQPHVGNAAFASDSVEPTNTQESKSLAQPKVQQRPDPVLSVPNNEPMVTEPSYSNRLQKPNVNTEPAGPSPVEPTNKSTAQSQQDDDDLLSAVKADMHGQPPPKPEPHSQEAKMNHYIRKINETDRLKGPDGNVQQAMHHFNELRKLLLNDKTLDDATRRKLIATQGFYPYKSGSRM